jgi:SM-20-related protein
MCYSATRVCLFIRLRGVVRPAKIGPSNGAKEDKAIRGDKIAWLDEPYQDPSINTFHHQINQLKRALNQSLFLGLDNFESHIAIYPPGTFYRRHVDQFHTKKERRISCVFYLNDHWESSYGGELRIYSIEGELIGSTLPLKNRFVCFESHLPHEVTTAYQPRYSIATWLKILRNNFQ